MQGADYALCLIPLASSVGKNLSAANSDADSGLGDASDTAFSDFIDALPDEPEKPRVPLEADGIQINFCKNPGCANFGVPAQQKATRGRAASIKRNPYTVVAAGKGYPHLRCNCCGEHFPIKSNAGIAEEVRRLGAYLEEKPGPSCTNDECENRTVPVSVGRTHYSSFGTTAIGSPRWKCKACGKTFSAAKTSTHRQRESHKNKQIFKLLVNRVPIRRICEIAEIGPKALYGKIDFIRAQCLAFAASREAKLAQTPINRLWLSVDRQDFIANWTQRTDRRNVAFTAVASTDNETGYCFGMHLNFDPSLDAKEAEKETRALSDRFKAPPFRKHARVWLPIDYEVAAIKKSAKRVAGSLKGKIESAYEEAEARHDIEASDQPSDNEQLPQKGVQIHSEYTLYGHFMHLKRLVGHAGKIRFFLDQDSGMRAACLGSFAELIGAERRVDAFYVSIAKNLNIDMKRRSLSVAQGKLDAFMEAHPSLSEQRAVLEMIKEGIAKMDKLGKWDDRWVAHPEPDMSEPEKMVCCLTDLGDYDADHMARLILRASLHATDSFFMQVRRRLSPLERPVHSQSNAGSVWNGYAPYNPAQIQKLLDILRVVHNFVLPSVKAGETPERDEKGKKIVKTPATRLGLAKAQISYEDILYFV